MNGAEWVLHNSSWLARISRAFIPEIDAFGRCLAERMLPAFSSIGHEADLVEKATYDALGAWAQEYDDPARDCQQAFDKGISFMMMMRDIQQGTINLFAAGLYHLCAQQLLLMYRRSGGRMFKQLDEKKVIEQLLKAGIPLKSFRSWKRVNELRLLANAVKHGDGRSCSELKELRPDLFVSPLDRDLGNAGRCRGIPVEQPVLGQGIYLDQGQFESYVECVKEFWQELASALDAASR